MIKALDADNMVYLDWAPEILPRSIGEDRLLSPDGNPFHYGLLPRLQFIHLLSEVYERKNHQSAESNRKAVQGPGEVVVIPSFYGLQVVCLLVLGLLSTFSVRCCCRRVRHREVDKN